jgi:tetratricopeptide (TPR) repeat protein
LVIDGIDHLEIPENRSRNYWLPNELPKGVCVVLSSADEQLAYWQARRGAHLFSLVGLMPEKTEQVCKSYLAFFGKRLDADLIERIVLTPASSNPLFLITLLEEVRLTGSQIGLKQRIIRLLEAPNFPTLFNLVMARYEEDFEPHRPHLVRDAMKLLWAARRGLSEQELCAFLGAEGKPLAQVLWSPLFLACERVFVYRQGRLAFASHGHWEAIRQRYLNSPEKQARARASLVHYVYYRGSYATKVRELPYQLYELNDWANLITVLTDASFFESLWRENKWDVLRYWATLERETDASAAKSYEFVFAAPDKFGTPTAVWSLSCLFDNLGHTVEAITLRKWMADYYRRAGDEANLIATLGNTGTLLGRQGRFDEALAMFREQEQVGRRLRQPGQVKLALANRANALLVNGDSYGARQAYERFKTLCDELNDRESLALYYNGIGQLQESDGELENALASFRQSAEISQEIGDLSMSQAAIGNQGKVLVEMGRFDEALKFLTLQEFICRNINHKEGLVGALGNRGMLLRKQGKAEEAVPLHIEEIEVARQIGFAYGLKQGLLHHAEALLSLNRLDGALELYQQGVAHCQSNNDVVGLKLARHQVVAVLERQGKARSKQGNLDGACASYRNMIQIGKENQEALWIDAGQRYLLSILHTECTKRLDENDYVSAMSLLREMEEVFADRNDSANLTHILDTELAVNHKQAEKEYDAANLEGKIALLQERGRIVKSLGLDDDVKANLGLQWTLFSHLLWEKFDAGELDAALSSAKKARSIGEALDDRDRIEKSLSNILMILGQKAELGLDQKKYATALELYIEAEQVAQELGSQEDVNAARHNQKLARRKISEAASPE